MGRKQTGKLSSGEKIGKKKTKLGKNLGGKTGGKVPITLVFTSGGEVWVKLSESSCILKHVVLGEL